MLKVIFLFKFRSDLDKADVVAGGSTIYGSIALKNPGMKRYVQNHFVGAIDAEHAEAGMGFDGCVKVLFENREAYERTMASPAMEGARGGRAERSGHVDAEGGFVNEHVMRWDADPDRRPYTSAEAPAPDAGA